MRCFVWNSGTAVQWKTVAGASTGNQNGTIDSLEILELKVGIVFSARCNMYLSHLCYDVSVCLSVRQSVCDGSALAHYS